MFQANLKFFQEFFQHHATHAQVGKLNDISRREIIEIAKKSSSVK